MTVMYKVEWIWTLNSSFKMTDEDASLDELVEQAQALLEQEKLRKWRSMKGGSDDKYFKRISFIKAHII